MHFANSPPSVVLFGYNLLRGWIHTRRLCRIAPSGRPAHNSPETSCEITGPVPGGGWAMFFLSQLPTACTCLSLPSLSGETSLLTFTPSNLRYGPLYKFRYKRQLYIVSLLLLHSPRPSIVNEQVCKHHCPSLAPCRHRISQW